MGDSNLRTAEVNQGKLGTEETKTSSNSRSNLDSKKEQKSKATSGFKLPSFISGSPSDEIP